jgi:hypothetical protein
MAQNDFFLAGKLTAGMIADLQIDDLAPTFPVQLFINGQIGNLLFCSFGLLSGWV